MAVLTKSALAQLLANIAADVANDTAHPNLAGLYNQSLDEPGDAISPVFRLRDWEVPYVVVTPGEVLLRSSGGGRGGRSRRRRGPTRPTRGRPTGCRPTRRRPRCGRCGRRSGPRRT